MSIWPFHRRRYKCNLYIPSKFDFCGHPAIACVTLYGKHHTVCAWHIAPLDEGRGAFTFLARSYHPVPLEVVEPRTVPYTPVPFQ